MKKNNTKEKLFEMMSYVDKSFKNPLNEDVNYIFESKSDNDGQWVGMDVSVVESLNEYGFILKKGGGDKWSVISYHPKLKNMYEISEIHDGIVDAYMDDDNTKNEVLKLADKTIEEWDEELSFVEKIYYLREIVNDDFMLFLQGYYSVGATPEEVASLIDVDVEDLNFSNKDLSESNRKTNKCRLNEDENMSGFYKNRVINYIEKNTDYDVLKLDFPYANLIDRTKSDNEEVEIVFRGETLQDVVDEINKL